MRWIWIDRILELKRGAKLVALKNISAAEDVLHDHFAPAPGSAESAPQPPRPLMPHSLIIEGMAQTAGILVGHAGDFKEKVILAKIGKAVFDVAVQPRPGFTIRHSAEMVRYDASGASTSGVTELIDPATGEARKLADIELMFSHIDSNRSGLKFPKENFVFTEQFMHLIRNVEKLED
ncbi:MAG: beta-hydroxyacyl-ACP dehydratase [Phycisphaeraceae bacterium]|nr:beta-hydroxyacyl-ACP dehydratase [Phycisphaeraceae bacterium]